MIIILQIKDVSFHCKLNSCVSATLAVVINWKIVFSFYSKSFFNNNNKNKRNYVYDKGILLVEF